MSEPLSPEQVGRVGVLMGGPSHEREISLKSGEAVLSALQRQGYDAVGVEVGEVETAAAKILDERVAVAFIAMHGHCGEDGMIQSILEGLMIPYTGSGIKASRLGIDKVASRELWEKEGLVIPRGYSIAKDHPRQAVNGVAWPVVVKPATQGSSIGLSLVSREEEFAPAVEQALSYDDVVLVEEYVRGREVTVGILDDQPLPVIQIMPKRPLYDYQAKYEPGLTAFLVPAPLPAEMTHRVQEVGLKAHRLLGCRSFSRVDMILNEEMIPVVLELNTIPGLTALSLLPKAARAVGIEFGALCVRLLASAYVPL